MVAISHLIHNWMSGAATAASLGGQGFWVSGLGGCNVSKAVLPVPAGQTILKAPTNLTLNLIGLAFGVQNYTCSKNNNYTALGAVAEILDISCFYDSEEFLTLQEPLFEAWSNFSTSATIQNAIGFLPRLLPADLLLGQHYFIEYQPNKNMQPVLSPTWDARATRRFRNDNNALFVGKGLATLPDPINPAVSVPWLAVGHVNGDLASEVFRVKTIGGQPPKSCTFGSSPNISVKYTGQYWFYGGWEATE